MFNKLFQNNKPLIGMIHLSPMPGYEKHPGMLAIFDKALTDLKTLEEAGYDGVLVENDRDQPHKIKVPAIIKKAFSEVMIKLLQQASIPVGMEIIYDMPATIRVAHDIGAQFVRLDVFVDNVETEWGKIPAQALELINLKKEIGASSMLLFTDIHVKHAKMLDNRSLKQSANEAIKYGTNALIVTGDWTGHPPSLRDCITVKKVAKNVPTLIGSGLNNDNVRVLLQYADGAIVGSSIKKGDYIDLQKAKQLVKLVKEIRSNIATVNGRTSDKIRGTDLIN